MSGNAKTKKNKPTTKPATKKRVVAGPPKKKAAAAKSKTAKKQSRPSPAKTTTRVAKSDPKKKQIGMILKKAIKGEEDGLHFYSLLAEKATNAEAKQKLEGLRDDEIRHKVTLMALYRKHVGGEIGKLPAHGITPLRKVFAKGHLDERKTEMDFITLAIEAELAAAKYYREQRNLIADPQFKEIFEQLSDEEHGHFELLQSEKEAIAGNYNWFAYGDSSPMEH